MIYIYQWIHNFSVVPEALHYVPIIFRSVRISSRFRRKDGRHGGRYEAGSPRAQLQAGRLLHEPAVRGRTLLVRRLLRHRDT